MTILIQEQITLLASHQNARLCCRKPRLLNQILSSHIGIVLANVKDKILAKYCVGREESCGGAWGWFVNLHLKFD